MMRVGSAPDRAPRMLTGLQFPKNGAEVDETAPFYARLLRDGDVVEVDAEGKPVVKAPARAPAGKENGA